MGKYKMTDEDVVILRKTLNHVKKLKIFKELEELKNKENNKGAKKKAA